MNTKELLPIAKKKEVPVVPLPQVKPIVRYELSNISPCNKWLYYYDGTYKVYPKYQDEFIRYFWNLDIVPIEFNVPKISFVDSLQ